MVKIKHIFNGRLFKILFSRKYIKKNLVLRRGECKCCGYCCNNFLFGFRCPFLWKNKCLIYKIRPKICRNSPVDEISLKENHPETCGFYFIKQKQK